MGRVLAAALVGWLALAAAAPLAAARDAPAPADSTAAVGGPAAPQPWLGRTLKRWFGREPRTAGARDGRAEQVAGRYAHYAGRPIEVVIVHPVLRFDEQRTDGETVSRSMLALLTSPLWSYTRESVVRQYLLFGPGENLDPYRLADSERLIRQLEFMQDARILVLPIGGGPSVAVIVETRDRWPFGLTGNIVDSDRYDGSVYVTNAFGAGVRMDSRLIVHRQREPDVGWRAAAAKRNLGGTFVDLRGACEDSWQALDRSLALERPMAHPAIRGVGGADWQDIDVRDNAGVPRQFTQTSAWAGWAMRLGDTDPFLLAAAGGRRRTLTPAVSYTDVDFARRPLVSRDTLRDYHDRHDYLVGLTWRNLADYTTSYLFRNGETEDVPDGYAVKLTAGYEDGEFLQRAVGYAEFDRLDVAPGGSIRWLAFGGGGYLRAGRFEDGQVAARAGYITPLLGGGAWRQRIYMQLSGLAGLNRTNPGGLSLSGRSGIHDLDYGIVRGDRRLVAQAEWRVFTPWRPKGFDVMVGAYGDLGVIGGEDDPLFQQKIHGAWGVGFRVDNPEFVLPAVEVRIGMTDDVSGRGVVVAFDLGNLSFPGVPLPGPRPELPDYR